MAEAEDVVTKDGTKWRVRVTVSYVAAIFYFQLSLFTIVFVVGWAAGAVSTHLFVIFLLHLLFAVPSFWVLCYFAPARSMIRAPIRILWPDPGA